MKTVDLRYGVIFGKGDVSDWMDWTVDLNDEDELDEWDANDLEDLPLIKNFVEDFEPCSPYDSGWSLNVEFVDPNE